MQQLFVNKNIEIRRLRARLRSLSDASIIASSELSEKDNEEKLGTGAATTAITGVITGGTCSKVRYCTPSTSPTAEENMGNVITPPQHPHQSNTPPVYSETQYSDEIVKNIRSTSSNIDSSHVDALLSLSGH